MSCGKDGDKCEVSLTVLLGTEPPKGLKSPTGADMLTAQCKRCQAISYLPPGWTKAPFYQGVFATIKEKGAMV